MASLTSSNTPQHGDTPPLLAWLRALTARPEGRLQLGGAAICLTLLGLIFWTNLRHLVHVWMTDENYSHGFLVPLISLYFANEAARRGPVALRAGVVPGLALLFLAICGRILATLVPIGVVADGALLVGLVGLFTLLLGTDALRRHAFPLAFLVFMVPLPTALYSMIASPLQMMVSQVASALLNAMSIPVLREGNTMTLPGDVRLFVAEACSGMRQLTGFLALTTAVAFLSPRPAWYRVLVVVSSVPIALAANLARVTLTGWIMYQDPRYAVGTYHTVEGLLMMGVGLALLAAFCRGLDLVCGLFTTSTPKEAARPLAVPRSLAGREPAVS